MSRICLYFVAEPERDRWVRGDRLVRPLIRRLVRGPSQPGGIDKVFINLRLGLDRLGIPYEVNLPFSGLRNDDRIGVVGRCRLALQGYDRANPIVAGSALMTHPSEWPTLCEDYPIVSYLQPCEWCNDLYKPFYGDRCRIWPVGIDTVSWTPADEGKKQYDFLIYDKIRWRRDALIPELLDPIKSLLARQNLSFREIRYGYYKEKQYKEALQRCRSMIFLCEHEGQGLACQECLAANVPVIAWDQGWCLDPNRFAWGVPNIPATSVPYFDERCGVRFRSIEEFPEKLTEFLDRRPHMAPRDYILENLTLEKRSRHYLQILDDVRSVHRAAPAISAAGP